MKVLIRAVLVFAFSLSLFSSPAYAALSILPTSEDAKSKTPAECADEIEAFDILEPETRSNVLSSNNEAADYWMACAVKSGNVKFWMVPYFVRNILQFLIAIAGLISVLMIMVGAYYYMAGGLTDDKEKGKKVITFAIGGLILTTISWFLVNVILLAITS